MKKLHRGRLGGFSCRSRLPKVLNLLIVVPRSGILTSLNSNDHCKTPTMGVSGMIYADEWKDCSFSEGSLSHRKL